MRTFDFIAGETDNDPDFARALAGPADIFVNDAFGAAHRSHASVVGLARLLPSYPGFLLASEIAAFEKVLNNPQRPLAALVGGAKISSKIGVLRNLVEKVDMLLLGGGMANTFLAANGLDMQASLVESGHLDDASDIQRKAREIWMRDRSAHRRRDGLRRGRRSGDRRPRRRAGPGRLDHARHRPRDRAPVPRPSPARQDDRLERADGDV